MNIAVLIQGFMRMFVTLPGGLPSTAIAASLAAERLVLILTWKRSYFFIGYRSWVAALEKACCQHRLHNAIASVFAGEMGIT